MCVWCGRAPQANGGWEGLLCTTRKRVVPTHTHTHTDTTRDRQSIRTPEISFLPQKICRRSSTLLRVQPRNWSKTSGSDLRSDTKKTFFFHSTFPPVENNRNQGVDGGKFPLFFLFGFLFLRGWGSPLCRSTTTTLEGEKNVHTAHSVLASVYYIFSLFFSFSKEGENAAQMEQRISPPSERKPWASRITWG